MDPPPPPPPPHGNNPRSNRGGLPDGNYDIFVIPPHSSGSGFLYLPSLQTHRNSFLAGVACTLFAVAVWTLVIPVLKDWFSRLVASGGMGIFMLLIGVGVASWAWGKTQAEGGWGASSGPGSANSGGSQPHGQSSGFNAGAGTSGFTPGAGAQSGYRPGGTGPHGGTPGGASAGGASSTPPPPKSSWQRPNPQAASGMAGSGTAKGGWEKAREETRKKEEERRRTEELKKKREADEKRRQEQRVKDAKEREEREKKEKLEKAAAERAERLKKAAAEKPESPKPSPKKPPPPVARTETEDDAYSFRPYDRPKQPAYKTSASSIYSESSYAASQSTSRTTPPPSHRGPYTTKDPDKIIIKAVYAFTDAFMKTPVAQLISGHGSVTDGLILRITTEGLFIDDDVRGVPQREWDVKAWTMKLVEVWCPVFGASSGSQKSAAFFKPHDTSRRVPTTEESDKFLLGLADACKKECRLPSTPVHGSTPSSSSAFHFSRSTHINDDYLSTQSAELRGLHVLRASIRDQEGKKYVFILDQSEGWKVAIGLQRLRRGTQVRALAVSGLPMNETNAIIQQLGWG